MSQEVRSEEVSKYSDILKANGVKNEVSQVFIKESDAKGEGKQGDIKCVTVKFVGENVNDLHLFVKMLPTNYSRMVEETKMLDKETLFLTEYVTAAKKFCASKG